MTYLDPDSEGTLEANAIGLFKELGWQAADCYRETFGTDSFLGRETSEQVVLERRLRAALLKLNHGISPLAIDLAVEELSKDRSVLSPEVRESFGEVLWLGSHVQTIAKRPKSVKQILQN